MTRFTTFPLDPDQMLAAQFFGTEQGNIHTSGNAPDVKKYRKGEAIFQPHDHADKIYYIVRGKVKICRYGDSGRELTKSHLDHGTIFGEMCLVGEHCRRDFAYAMEDTAVRILPLRAINQRLAMEDTFRQFILRILGQRMMEMGQRLEAMVFQNARTRIIEYLHRLGQQKGQRVGYEMLVRKFMTHQEIASITATSRQTVTTVLNELREDNILSFNRQRLLIRDMSQLANAAK